MDDTMEPQPTMEAPAGYEALLDQYLAEIQRLNEKMRKDQADIDRLKVETAALKAETQVLKAETRAILQRLETMV